MGYSELSRPTLRIPFERDDGTIDQKQIDVFAKDDETVLVIECKSSAKRTRRSLQKDIAETASFKRAIANAIRRHYGRDFKPKIIWCYATRNVIWSEQDLIRADSERIVILTENEFAYYDAYIRHMGRAGRFQILAELLKGQKVAELQGMRVPAVKGKLGKHVYFSFVTTPRHLLKIAFVNHLALNHPDGRPAYQRMVNKSRLQSIARFINGGGCFPTNLLVNFTQSCRFDVLSNRDSAAQGKYGWLYLPDKYKSAWIIDGQHRLYGYSFADDAHWDDDIFVLAFQNMDTSTEADMFITINSKQKSVPKSILVALQADLKWNSEDSRDRLGAISSALIKALNSDSNGPFFRKILMEGIQESSYQPLTIPELVKGLDRAKLLGRVVNERIIPGPLSDATDDATVLRARKIINAYFDDLRTANETRWELGKEGFLLTNAGVRAYLLLIAEILTYLDQKTNLKSLEAPETQIIEAIRHMSTPVFTFVAQAADSEFAAKFSRQFGEGGVRVYFSHLCDLMCVKHPDFGSEEYRTYKKQSADSRLTKAHSDVIQFQKRLMDYVLHKLIAMYGGDTLPSGEPRYWAIGIESATAKSAAYAKSQHDAVEKRKPIFAYLDFIDLQGIIRQKNNWDAFKDVFSIPRPGEKGKIYYLDWMTEFNELRRIPAHPSSLRVYDDDQYRYLEWLTTELAPRLAAAEKRLQLQQ